MIHGLCKCEIEKVWSVMTELTYEKRIGKIQASVLGEGVRGNRKKIPGRVASSTRTVATAARKSA